MNHLTDPQCLAFEGRPYDPRTVEIMEWLASPDGGALRTDQAMHVAREIAMGRVPHVSMMPMPMPVMTVDGGRTWSVIK